MNVEILTRGPKQFQWVIRNKAGQIIEESSIFTSFEECAADAARHGHRVTTPPPSSNEPPLRRPPTPGGGMGM